MNTSKFLSALSRVASIAGIAAVAGLAFNIFALPLFGTAVALFIVLVIASDYAPRGNSYTRSFTPATLAQGLSSPLRLAA